MALPPPPALQIFNDVLTNAFQATDAFVLANDGQDAVLDFVSTVSVAAKIEWYLEFSFDDPSVSAGWKRELAQEDAGSGVIGMPEVVRTITANGGGTLGVGTHRDSAQLRRHHVYCRAQVRASVGTVTNLTVVSVFGLNPDR